MNTYAQRVYSELAARVPWETEFLQAVREVFGSLDIVLTANPRFEKLRILERLVEPERTISFRFPWVDDRNTVHIIRGYRVQHCSVLGPYKGGLRFHSSVSLGSLKFLGFEQTLKNALTGLPMGGGKGGADFQTRGRSDEEIMRLCQSFMTELYRHIGPDIDVPAGDIGVGTREIGYLFGQYRRVTNRYRSGVLTGKGLSWGGSRIRPEATGYGVVYFTERMLNARGDSIKGKKVAVSGFGNVAWGVVQKIDELGGRVVTLSGPDGFIHDPDGVRDEKIKFMLTMRSNGNDAVREYADRFSGVEFVPGKKPWSVPVDVAIPCAIQNELDLADARALVDRKCLCVTEGANMPVTAEAANVFESAKMLYAPGKAANAGGVAVSGLEMSQNSARTRWTEKKVDARLRQIMEEVHDICIEAAAGYGKPGNYVIGANIAGFLRIAEAMIDQGII